MEDANNEFTDITTLRAEALGEPGQRTFRVTVDSGTSSALMWLEKEQLFQLAVAVKQVLITASAIGDYARGLAPGHTPTSATSLEFKVGKLTLGLDGGSGRVMIDIHDVESVEDSPATLRVWGDPDQFSDFAKEALRVCAAGRPACPLCGNPMDADGHACARSNGHGLQDLDDLQAPGSS